MGSPLLLCGAVLSLLVAAGAAVPLASPAAYLERVEEEIRSTFDTGETSPFLEEVAKDLSLPAVLQHGGSDVWPAEEYEEKAAVFCAGCKMAVDQLLKQIAMGTPMDVIFNATVILCTELKLSTPIVCQSMIQLAKPQVSWIFTNTELTGRDVCGTVFVGQNCHSDKPERTWEIQMPAAPKPALTSPTVPAGGPTLKVLHLADTHFDPEYLPGGNANCADPFCCREESGTAQTAGDAAGYWGDYRNCDSPRWTLEAIYTQILEAHPDISFIIWTGDLVPHNVWNTSVEGNLQTIRESVAMVQQYFPGIPVFPSLGNHEAHPIDAYTLPYIDNEFDISWLYDEISALWQTWLPADVADSIMYSGYYVAQVLPELRLLSVNTNYCYSFNWWLLYDSVDPGEVLSWMAAELQRAEDDGVMVYIIGHVPSGNEDCSYSWSHQYNRLVARYEGIIAGIFYGHTHKDHFQIFFDPDNPQRAMKVGFIAQSQTTYSDLNPGYKVYTIDGIRKNSTYSVLDHENWYFDLDQANADNQPTFQVLYTAKEEYGMPDLSAQSHLDLVYEMAQNGSAKFDLFYKNYYKAGRPHMESGYTDKTKHYILCRLLVSDTTQRQICDKLPVPIH